ncbi:type IV pilus assembly protein FimV [Derxia lacustris]|uniref:type IV pilus assembly protein FimV n=1 Tax=Derxia lacustris TaxID=764842 RepID=UPI000A174ED8|nr:hypothetical protein [Derxia lacustris]
MSAIPALFPFRRLRGVSRAVSLALALVSTSASALGLGDIELRSHLGQPFQAEIAVRLAEGELLGASCVNVPRGDGGDIPGIGSNTVSVETRGGRTLILVRGRGPFSEPVARIVVEAGCDTRVTREFVVFVDPAELASAPLVREAPGLPAAALPPAARATAAAAAAPAAADPARAAAARRRPAAQRQRVAPVATGVPVEAAVAAAPPASPRTTERTAASRPAGDRLRMVSPEDAQPIGGQVAADRLAAAEEARVVAEARLAAREQELAAQIVALGKEIDALKKHAAVQVEHASAVVDDGLPPWWALALAAGALLAVAIGLGLYRRQRELMQLLRTAPWQQATADEPAAFAAASAAAAATVAPLAAYDSETDPRYAQSIPDLSRRIAPVEVNFPDRLGEIEVEELNGTRALNALRTEPEAVPRSGVVTRSAVLDLPDEEFELATTQGQPALQAASVFDAAQLPPLDFDLGMPEAEGPIGAGFGMTATLPLGDTAPAVALAGARPVLATGEARRIQTRLRATVDAVEQADNYVENGQFESAAVTLGRYIEEHPDAPRAAWLMLLELYRRTDRTPAYEKLAVAFADRFGRPARPWDQAGSLDRGVGLDSNPEMLQSIWAKWGTPEAIGLLADLLEDPAASETDYYNLALQRDLLNFVKICPLDA